MLNKYYRIGTCHTKCSYQDVTMSWHRLSSKVWLISNDVFWKDSIFRKQATAATKRFWAYILAFCMVSLVVSGKHVVRGRIWCSLEKCYPLVDLPFPLYIWTHLTPWKKFSPPGTIFAPLQYLRGWSLVDLNEKWKWLEAIPPYPRYTTALLKYMKTKKEAFEMMIIITITVRELFTGSLVSVHSEACVIQLFYWSFYKCHEKVTGNLIYFEKIQKTCFPPLTLSTEYRYIFREFCRYIPTRADIVITIFSS